MRRFSIVPLPPARVDPSDLISRSENDYIPGQLWVALSSRRPEGYAVKDFVANLARDWGIGIDFQSQSPRSGDLGYVDFEV